MQNALGAINAGAYDLNAGCSGFIYALVAGSQAIASGECERVLVIGADTLSRTVDWEDRSTSVLFGDGAGAVVLRASTGSAGVLANVLGADGSGCEMLYIPAGGSAKPACQETIDQREHYIRMNGSAVYYFATRILPNATEQVLRKAGLTLDQINLLIPHQANRRIIESAAKRLKLPIERFAMNLQEYGNTSAASIPIALCEAHSEGRIQPDDNLLMVGFGAGLTWAAGVVCWSAAQGGEQRSARGIWRWMVYTTARLRSLTRSATIRTIRKMDECTRQRKH